MLSLQPNHQVMYHLSQLSNSLSSNTAQVMSGLKTLCAKKTGKSQEANDVLCNESLDEAVKNCNKDLAVHLSKICRKSSQSGNEYLYRRSRLEGEDFKGIVELLAPHKPLHLKCEVPAPWQISYISSDTFEGNKRLGFHQVPAAQTNGSLYFLTTKDLRPLLLRQLHQPLKLGHQQRGFKTQRMTVKDKESNSDLLSQVANLFRPKPDPKPAEVEKLVDAKMSAKAVAAALTKVYGEGYTAGKTMTKLRKFRWFLYGMLTVSLIMVGRAFMYRINFSISDPIKQVLPEDINVTFADVRGSEEVKKELITVVSFLKNPKKFMALGARLPKGVLLVGEPGVGKTLLARAVAGEARVPFFYASGSEFDEILVGEGARRIRNLFRIAKANAPCVIFLDEIDSVGGSRTKSSIHPYANQSINQLLSEMDGFQPNEGVVVLAATNRASDLDKALVRPGRFDMSIQVPRPRKGDRRDIIQYYLQKIACRNIDIDLLVKMTAGWNGATLENLLNWAAILAATENSEFVHMHHILNAYDRLVLGVSWGSANANELQKELRRTAYHEAGHTLVSLLTPGCSPIHKVTIEARGSALGHTASLFDEEILQTKAALRATLDSCFGGQVAEEIIYGTDEVSTGCSSDLEKATSIAKIMVKQYGMGGTNRHLEERESLSGEAQTAIDKDIDTILNESKERARNMLLKHAADLHKIAGALLEYKTLTKADLMQLLDTPDEAKSPNDQ